MACQMVVWQLGDARFGSTPPRYNEAVLFCPSLSNSMSVALGAELSSSTCRRALTACRPPAVPEHLVPVSLRACSPRERHRLTQSGTLRVHRSAHFLQALCAAVNPTLTVESDRQQVGALLYPIARLRSCGGVHCAVQSVRGRNLLPQCLKRGRARYESHVSHPTRNAWAIRSDRHLLRRPRGASHRRRQKPRRLRRSGRQAAATNDVSFSPHSRSIT
jgi:hypothetical protein